MDTKFKVPALGTKVFLKKEKAKNLKREKQKIDVSEYCKHRKNPKKPPTSNPIKAELGGYMPLRNEFEYPYNDQAEVPVATIKASV